MHDDGKTMVREPVAMEPSTPSRCGGVSDSLKRGEAPIASHLLYTQPGVLDDSSPEERHMGIDAGLAWGHEAEATVVYMDRGKSRGMQYGIDRAIREDPRLWGRKWRF